MILYHGTNQDIDQIDLSIGLRYKDFGQGFYLTPDFETAKRMARKKSNLFKGAPTVITYELPDDFANNTTLRIKQFPPQATAEWFLFVFKNRNRNLAPDSHGYDIIIGPIADDGVVLTFEDYKKGLTQPEEAAIALQDKYFDQQYFFGTLRALSFLKKLAVCIL